MREENEFMKHYGAEDFRRYHSGEMSEQEMHALEKASLEDPFLADALEGFAHAVTPVADIDALKQKISKNSGAVKPIRPYKNPFAMFAKVAAVLVVGGGLGWLVFHKKYPEQDKELAGIVKTEKQHADSMVAAGLDSALVSANNPAITITEPATKPETHYTITDTVANGSTATLATSNGALTNNGEGTYQFTVSDSAKNFANVAANNNMNSNNGLSGKLPGISVKNIPVSFSQARFKGRVVDSKGAPIPFASLTDQRDKKGVLTDADGKFDFEQNDSVAFVDVSALGYKSQLASLRSSNTDSNILVLQAADSKLSEVVITQVNKDKRKDIESDSWKKSRKKEAFDERRITVSNAIPVNGWDAFYRYVNDSLKTITSIDQYTSSAEISISFDVNEKGEPVNITAGKSLCDKCREEAIRIFKEGPAWRLNGKKKKASALVRF